MSNAGRNGYYQKCVARSKRPIADAGNVVRNRDPRKISTVIECGVANMDHSIGDCDASHGCAILERAIADADHAVGNRHVYQTAAVEKSITLNGRDRITLDQRRNH